MIVVRIRYGVGYGRHEETMEFEDDATEKEIEEAVGEYVMQKLDWGFEVIEAGDYSKP